MADYIGLYFDSDETLVSEEGIFENSITISVRADLNEESDPVELYLEAEDGYIVYDTEVFILGDTDVMWRIAETELGLDEAEWGDPLNIGTVENGLENRKPVFIQCKAADTETPVLDVEVTLFVEGLAEPVIP